MREAVLFEVFLGLQNFYNALDRERSLELLAVYGVNPSTLQLLWKYWDQLTMVTKAAGYLGRLFKGY